eukprot:16055803-Heterocapsa_arctica.AAC.1
MELWLEVSASSIQPNSSFLVVNPRLSNDSFHVPPCAFVTPCEPSVWSRFCDGGCLGWNVIPRRPIGCFHGV